MNTLKTQESKIEGLPKKLHDLNLSFIHELAHFVGNYGEWGELLGMRGFRLVVGEEKPIDIISVINSDYLILALSIKNNLPPEDNAHVLKIISSGGQEIGLVIWDFHISLNDVRNAIAQFKLKLN